ncbi:MAG: hypothetical protein A3J52_02235 [Omnitrophica bacterium RIFCSPHIGHO2_02_FULL_49_9]|nr:MAG: hypothetical protein A3J52_02235 [Omnitrophica bacterium RIFCSPHIGHO2_02_FULL_49_9]
MLGLRPRGIRLPSHKDRTLYSLQIGCPPPPPIVKISLPKQMLSSLSPCVHVGDSVCVGTKVVESFNWMSVPIHSSVSGKVSEVHSEFIVIESDGLDRPDASIQVRGDIPLESDWLINTIRENGIVDLGGSGEPIHPRLLEARGAGVETVILNACESEPFLTSDHVLMINHAVEVLKGAELIRVACGAKRVVIATEWDKREAIEVLNSKNYNLKFKTIETAMLPVRYPQGDHRVLFESVTRKKLAKGETFIAKGVLIEHVATAFAVYEAVYLRKPFYERVITVSGSCVADPKNLWARRGTPAVELLSAAKGFLRSPDRVIFGGPMTGEPIDDFDRPVTPEVRAILALPAESVAAGVEEPCIRCGLCVDTCPETLIPEALVRAVRGKDHELEEEYRLDACTECGVCAYVCPSKIPIVSILREGKRQGQKKESGVSHPSGFGRVAKESEPMVPSEEEEVTSSASIGQDKS